MADSSSPSNFQNSVFEMLKALDPEPTRPGLEDTPKRVEKAMQFYCRGYEEDPHQVIGNALFEAETDEMVLVKDIEIYSLCEHHLAPFYGRAHVAYIPSDHIVGLSKIARLVDVYARRLQVQERLTRQIAETVKEVLDPIGVAVIMEGQHMCMQMRGVEKQNSLATTSSMLGKFRESDRTRSEFLSIISL